MHAIRLSFSNYTAVLTLVSYRRGAPSRIAHDGKRGVCSCKSWRPLVTLSLLSARSLSFDVQSKNTSHNELQRRHNPSHDISLSPQLGTISLSAIHDLLQSTSELRISLSLIRIAKLVVNYELCYEIKPVWTAAHAPTTPRPGPTSKHIARRPAPSPRVNYANRNPLKDYQVDQIPQGAAS